MKIPQPLRGHIDKHLERVLDVADRLVDALNALADSLNKMAEAEKRKEFAPGGVVRKPGRTW